MHRSINAFGLEIFTAVPCVGYHIAHSHRRLCQLEGNQLLTCSAPVMDGPRISGTLINACENTCRHNPGDRVRFAVLRVVNILQECDNM